MPPSTSPNVAHASAISVVEFRPKRSAKTPLQAAPVPCPPESVTEPASRPTAGDRPSAAATLTPTRSCTTSRPSTTARNSATVRPPLRRLARSALSPIEAKNMYMNCSCRLVSKRTLTSNSACPASMRKATVRPPSTGSGMLYCLKGGTQSASLRPSSSASAATTKVS